MEPIRHPPDIFLGNAAVVRQHGLNAVLVHVGIELVHGGVQQLAEALGLEAAAEQHIAPVVAHAPLPALGIRELDRSPAPCGGAYRRCPSPADTSSRSSGDCRGKHSGSGYRCCPSTVGTPASRQYSRGQNTGQTLPHPWQEDSSLSDVQHLNELGVVAVALDLHELLKGRLVIGRVRREADNIFIPVELKGVHTCTAGPWSPARGLSGPFYSAVPPACRGHNLQKHR